MVLSLPSRSINYFETLGEQFLTHFTRGIRAKRQFANLTAIRQREAETLKEFLTRWQRNIQKVEDLDDRTALTLFTSLRSGDLFTSLRSDTPDTYAQAIQQANKYAEMEEAIRQKQERGAKRSCDEVRTSPMDRLPKRESRPSNLRKPDKPRHEVGPILKTHQVYEIKPPRHMSVGDRSSPHPWLPDNQLRCIGPSDNGPKYCRYHRRLGHTTEECITL
ncbi:uncharacterized protein LOC116033094 [Ipomoea triloba]|uniref:uncharacterized protein LOC116033094 n=1 Tax=Ipomoea triloba TaxID=35885 RepID=UPI00125CF4F5|nr:uncharacterized protein LOC116033094 [Ipomoea triloba]